MAEKGTSTILNLSSRKDEASPKILLINQTFYPDLVATAQQLTDLAVEFVKKGCEVTVLASRRGYTEPHPVYPARENYQGVQVIRVCPFSLGRETRIRRILDAFMVMICFAWQLLWLPRFHKVAAMTTPPLVAWIGLIFSKLRRSQFFYWVMDINPDQAIEAGWIRANSRRARILRNILKFILKRSEHIVVLDRFMKDRLIIKGASPDKIAVIPPWSHDEDLETVSHSRNPFRKKYGLDDKFVVMYSGNHSVCHPLDTLLEAALAFKEDPSIVFIFIGSGERASDVTHFKNRYHLSSIIQLPYQERSELKYSLSAADLHTVVMGEPYVGITHPCKIYGILKIGRPFVYVGPEESPMGELISSERVGCHVDHHETQKLVEAIHQVRQLEPTAKEEIETREKRVAERFSRATLSSQLVELVIKS